MQAKRKHTRLHVPQTNVGTIKSWETDTIKYKTDGLVQFTQGGH